MIKQKAILWIAIIVSLITYMGWKPIHNIYGVQVFYVGMALFINLLAIYIWRNSRRKLIPAFILLTLSINNLLDELFYDPTKFQANEILFLLLIIIYSFKLYKNDRIE